MLLIITNHSPSLYIYPILHYSLCVHVCACVTEVGCLGRGGEGRGGVGGTRLMTHDARPPYLLLCIYTVWCDLKSEAAAEAD